jgi:hypothetical protein
MLFLRTVLIFVLGISVVAAIPVSSMTSSIDRRMFRKILGMQPKPLLTPTTLEEAKERINGLWTTTASLETRLGRVEQDIYAKFANGGFVELWPNVVSASEILKARKFESWTRIQNIEHLKSVSGLSRFEQSDVDHFVEGASFTLHND